jgi:uncharacterized protein (DUF1697 family)
MRYVALLRGINVGGKNTVEMAGLKKCLEELGFHKISTYIASGNLIFESDKPAGEVAELIEKALPEKFKLDDDLIKVLVLSSDQLQSVIDNKPRGFGDEPEKYHSDAIFLIGIDAASVMPLFRPREGVDRVWPGNGVIYSQRLSSQRLSSQRTKSRLSKIMGEPEYKSMTIRTWGTVLKLLEMLK